MTIRTQIKAGDAGGDSGRLASNHSEVLKVRSTVNAGGLGSTNHNEALRVGSKPAIAMLRQPRTTSRKEDRLELLVVRAGLRVGRVSRRLSCSR